MPSVTYVGGGRAGARIRFPDVMVLLFPIHFAVPPRVMFSEAQVMPSLSLRVPKATLVLSE